MVNGYGRSSTILLARILREHEIEPAAGDYRWYRPDMILLPEYAVALLAEDLLRRNDYVFPAEQLLVVADHFSPPATIERAQILRLAQDCCEKLGWPLRLFEGICHQLLIEDPRTQPMSLIIGSDSHTVTAGALGCLALGFGSTDIYAALATGRIALYTPAVIKIVLKGRLPEWVMGKDVMLEVFRRFGLERLSDRALEFVDRTDAGVSQSDRFAICNMIAEAGGKAAMFVPDHVTRAYLEERDGQADFAIGPEMVASDAGYVETHEIDVGELEPLVAMPDSPFNVRPVSQVEGLKLHEVFIGSCNAGRLGDLAVAAGILDGRRIAPGLKAIAIPGSVKVYLDAIEAGYVKALMNAGVVIGHPSCGPCGGIDKGLLAAGERCAATINRNYRGRMGSPDAEIFLVSPAVAAASMITGELTHPRGVT